MNPNPLASRRISRRSLIVGSTVSALGTIYGAVNAPKAQTLIATPRQTRGPYYPIQWEGDIDNDLVQNKSRSSGASGQVLHVQGIVFDLRGHPIDNAVVEIWHADSAGYYVHPADLRTGDKRDTHFQGRGRTRTDDEGGYRFRTIRPAAYPGRTPHIHFRVAAPKKRALTTQMYFADEPGNARDALLISVRDPARREKLITTPTSIDHIEYGAARCYFDIVVV
ncbi:MAG: hypothetical protein ACR2PG_09645 [Hyphomicrobiaceae bacterium]